MKKNKKQTYGRIHSIKLPHPSKTHDLFAESKFCKKSPSVFNYYLLNETIQPSIGKGEFSLSIGYE